MSREIDESKPLSEEDRAYLDQRGQYHVIERIDRANGQDGAESADEEPGSDMSDAETRAGKAYEKWTVAELQAEVDRRNGEIEDDDEKLAPASGKKSDLIEALRADDEALASGE